MWGFTQRLTEAYPAGISGADGNVAFPTRAGSSSPWRRRSPYAWLREAVHLAPDDVYDILNFGLRSARMFGRHCSSSNVRFSATAVTMGETPRRHSIGEACGNRHKLQQQRAQCARPRVRELRAANRRCAIPFLRNCGKGGGACDVGFAQSGHAGMGEPPAALAKLPDAIFRQH